MLELVPSQAAFDGRLAQTIDDPVTISVRGSEGSAPYHLGIRLARGRASGNAH
jgi:hypothetical protein